MAWTKIDGRGLTIPELRKHVAGLTFDSWRPSGLVLHNTGAPSLAQWIQGSGAKRMKSLENYYRNEQKWSAGPHAFVDDERIWLFTPFNKRGTHSPSFNGTRIGIEMVGDYARDSVTEGRGREVWRNTVALFAILCARLGLDPTKAIALHKEDPKTTHDCPGKNIKKAAFIAAVQDFMGEGGDHVPEHDPTSPEIPPLPAAKAGRVKVAQGDTLNMRAGSTASSAVVAELAPGAVVEVLGDAMNGTTKWLRVKAGGKTGWVAARYVSLT